MWWPRTGRCTPRSRRRSPRPFWEARGAGTTSGRRVYGMVYSPVQRGRSLLMRRPHEMRTTPWLSAAAAAAVLCTLPEIAPAGSAGATVGSGSQLQWLEYGEALERGKAENKHVLID